MSRRPVILTASAPLGAGLLACCAVASCLVYPQRVPGPLHVPELEAPAPAAPEPGDLRATVQRDSAPVWVRRPGQSADYALPFHRKRERLPCGAMVRTGAGGQAEIFWSPDATSVVLFDEARVTLGDPERDEPLVRFHSVSHALLALTPEDRIELPGGALLQGDASDDVTTVTVERDPSGMVRVSNQSQRLVRVRYREETLDLGPGESIDLPELRAGSGPRETVALERALAQGIALAWHGPLQHTEDEGGVRVRAGGPAWVAALGVIAHLEDQQEARFSGLSQVSTVAPADASAQPSNQR